MASAAPSAGPTTRLIGERGAELITSLFKVIASERCRQRSVDEGGSDEVDLDRRQFECQAWLTARGARR